ncbi:MAG TPA: hypothetical protein VMZ27_14505 [Candidatus Saccharimonadales bacterium]|nr:hypothetical protein [Candidatus Saccharimonadales bacterium]
MGLFKKKADPISERAHSLNEQIAALEAEIQRLSEAPQQTRNQAAPQASQTPSPPAAPDKVKNGASRQPRLRSTARPFGQGTPAVASTTAQPVAIPRQEPVFEDDDQNRLKHQPETATPKHYNDLGVRKYDLPALWKRIRSHFSGPATTNPKLVNYLAAGSIQGLRPLRYEKRVARNRFLVLVGLLILVMWGIIALFKRS